MYAHWVFSGATVIAVVAIVVTVLDDDDVHPTALSTSRHGMRDRVAAPPQPRLGGTFDADIGPLSMVTTGRNLEMDAISIVTAVSLTAAMATEVTGLDDDGVHPAASSAVSHDRRDRVTAPPHPGRGESADTEMNYRPMSTAGTKTDAISIFKAVSVIAAVAMAVTRSRNR